MAVSLATSGSNLALEITHTFPPKYWKKKFYENEPYLRLEVGYNSKEFNVLQEEIREAQENHGLDYFDEIDSIERIQNPYSYARFMLRKKYLTMKYGYDAVYQVRKYKLIREKYIDVALKYNCDVRRFGKDFADYRFFDSIPRIWNNYALIVVQQLSVDIDEESSNNENSYEGDDDDYEDESEYDDENESEDEGESEEEDESEDDNNECDRDSEFYIEYVVYFDV